ncbi:hypothetical protein LEWO105114_05780 [Legionella worsleiensis]|uniref:Uncharacterized protein n=1 Tax=Legionella worsleiensis TaxID=45076 RepID=A0A0W1AG81_9GAMM|nr:hypothetical protein Lwor_1022 [Legionella worsleiensis]STY32756.1 Uncharacterised protein [Legionella worsleiensis]
MLSNIAEALDKHQMLYGMLSPSSSALPVCSSSDEACKLPRNADRLGVDMFTPQSSSHPVASPIVPETQEKGCILSR